MSKPQAASRCAYLCLIVAGYARADELIFERRMEFGSEGVVAEEVDGSPVVTLADGSSFVVGIRNLRAADGTVFGVDYDLGQASEGAPMDATVRVWRLEPPARDPADMAGLYAEVNPDASREELTTLEAALGNARGSGLARGVSIASDVRAWLETGEEDRMAIVALLADHPDLDLPPPVDDLLETDPAAALDRMESRLLAIEAHRTRAAELRDPIVAELEAAGSEVTGASWMAGTVYFEAGPEAVRAMIEDSRFSRIQFEGESTVDSNDGIAARAATQMTQFVQAGYLGERPSDLNGKADIFAVVIDGCIDEDHPAWNDTSTGSPRLDTVWRWDTSLNPDAFRALLSTEDSATGACHGNGVSGILAADLTDGQDATVTDTALQADRSGNALEATFDFLEYDASSFGQEVDKLADLNPDVVVMSFGTGGDPCDVDDANNAEVESLFGLDVLVAKSASNDGHSRYGPCSVTNPGASAAILVVGALETTAVPDLQAGILDPSSSQGPDVHGRALVDLLAPGRETSNLPIWNNGYRTTASFLHTSAATPVLGGAVSNLKDLLSTFLPASVYNDVGNLYATMLLMGDGTLSENCSGIDANYCSDPGATATHGDALDQRWGAGRLRMRMFTDDGMDSPWRARWCVRTIGQSETGTCLTNPDGGGTNQSLSSDVERLRAAAYWFEPNLGSVEDPANIAFAAYKNGGFQYQTAGTAPSKKRLREDAANDAAWEVRVIGWCVPEEDAIFDEEDPYANCTGDGERTVHISLYWEDMDRETLDPEIQ